MVWVVRISIKGLGLMACAMSARLIGGCSGNCVHLRIGGIPPGLSILFRCAVFGFIEGK